MKKFNNVDYHDVNLSDISSILDSDMKDLFNDLFVKTFRVVAYEDCDPHIYLEYASLYNINITYTFYINFPREFDFKATSIIDYLSKVLHSFHKSSFRTSLPEFSTKLFKDVVSNRTPDLVN